MPIAAGPMLNDTTPIASRVLDSLLPDNGTRAKIELNDLSHPDSVVYVLRSVFFPLPCSPFSGLGAHLPF